METGHPGGPRARTLYDVLALLSRPRYSQRQDNERPRGSARREERLLGDVALYTPWESPYVFQDYRLITAWLELHPAGSWKFLFPPLLEGRCKMGGRLTSTRGTASTTILHSIII